MTQSSIAGAARGIGSGVAVLAFLLGRIGGIPRSVLGALLAVDTGTLVLVAGPSVIREAFGRDRPTGDGEGETADWWLANLERRLEDVWNRWSDLVLVVGLAGHRVVRPARELARSPPGAVGDGVHRHDGRDRRPGVRVRGRIERGPRDDDRRTISRRSRRSRARGPRRRPRRCRGGARGRRRGPPR